MLKNISVSGVILCAAVLVFGGTGYGFTGSYDETISMGDTLLAKFHVVSKEGKIRTESGVEGQSDMIIKNEEGTFRYFPNRKAAMKLPVEAENDNLLDHMDNYLTYLEEQQAVKVGTETLDGDPCDIYEFKEHISQSAAKAWVSQAKEFPLQVKIEFPEGVMTIRMANIRIGGDLDDSLFQIPPDVEVISVPQMGGLQPQPASAAAGSQQV